MVSDRADSSSHADQGYARGYTISLDKIPAPKSRWVTDTIASVHITRDSRLPLAKAQGPHHFVAALGMIWNANLPQQSTKETLEDLLTALTRSETEFFGKLDQASGRFVLIYQINGAIFVCGDATAMKSIMYSERVPGVIASHGGLLSKMIAAEKSSTALTIMSSEKWKLPQSRYLPGSLTEWQDIHYLTANTKINLNSGEIERFWPRQPISQSSLLDVAERVSNLMHSQMAWLKTQERPLLMSLTAGIDSRVAFSIASQYEDIEYFTYSDGVSAAHIEDCEVAAELAISQGKQHRILPVSKNEDQKVIERIKANNRISHLPHVASSYLRHFPQDAVHVRSNLAEIGRVFYKNHFKSNPTSPEDMAAAWRKMSTCLDAVAAFDAWSNKVDFLGAMAISQIEAPDLFYWEHRMSCWHGRVVCESDIAFDTVSLFNNRQILMTLLSLPRDERIGAAAFIEIIKTNAPELLAWPVNGEPIN